MTSSDELYFFDATTHPLGVPEIAGTIANHACSALRAQ
jgi:hypothetical protein